MTIDLKPSAETAPPLPLPGPHPAYLVTGHARQSRWLVTCDHASNAVPEPIDPTLGISPQDMARHIAFDIGAKGLAHRLAHRLDAPVIESTFSRLVIDPNRGEDDPTLLMKLYDGTIIPANRHADEAEKQRRLNALHRPYHAAYEALAAQRPDRAICAIHSFTPQLKGRPPRPWQAAVLYSHRDTRLALPLIEGLRAAGILTGDNEPYSGHLDGDSIDRHALQTSRPNVLIEVRNDLIASEDGQIAWADLLAPIIETALRRAGI